MLSSEQKLMRPLDILLIEDTEADIKIAQRAFEKSSRKVNLFVVHDGEEALRFLKQEAPYDDKKRFPLPDIILLDINMPKVNGLDLLKTIKNHSFWRRIPVVIFTTSQDEKDVIKSYEEGASGFIPKPVTYDDFVSTVETFNRYWGQLIRLPKAGKEV